MALPNKVEQFHTDADVIHRLAHGGPDEVVQTEGGPVPTVARVVAQAQSILAGLAVLGPELAAPGGADLVRLASGETVQAAVAALAHDIGLLQGKLADGLTTSNVAEGANKYFTGARVRDTALDGLSLVSGAAVADTDTVLTALGKLQKQLNTITSTLSSGAQKTGDVVTTARVLASPDWLPCDGAAYAKAAYPALFAALGEPFSMSDGAAITVTNTPHKDIAWSPDGVYAAAAMTASPYIEIFKRTGDTIAKVAAPAVLPVGNGLCIAWSPDGNYLAHGSTSADGVRIYKRTGDTFTKLAHDSPGNSVNSMAWTPDGSKLICALGGAPGLYVYSRIGDTITWKNIPLGVAAFEVCINHAGTEFTVATGTSYPFLQRYSIAGDTIATIATSLPPATPVTAMAYSPDDKYIAFGSDSANRYLAVTKVDDRTAELVVPQAPGPVYGLTFSADGALLFASTVGADRLFIIRRYGGAFLKHTPQGSYTKPAVGTLVQTSLTPDGKYVLVAGDTAPYVWYYKRAVDATMFLVPYVAAEPMVRTYIKS